MRSSALRQGLALCATLAAAPLAAQTPEAARTPPHDSTNITLLDITIDPNVNEPHVVFLQRHVVYKASFSETGVTIEMRSFGNKALPFIVPASNGTDASGGEELEIYPQADGEIQFKAVFNELQRPVHFRLWSDARATRRGERSAAEGFWQLGYEIMSGFHPDYAGPQTLPAHAGLDLGACLSVRNGPGRVGRLNGCIAGFGGMTGEVSGQLFQFYTEPRFRIRGGGSHHSGWATELGALAGARIYAWSKDGGNFGPVIFGFGGYLARDQRGAFEGKGWRLSAALRADRFKYTIADPVTFAVTSHVHWEPVLEIGVGRYF